MTAKIVASRAGATNLALRLFAGTAFAALFAFQVNAQDTARPAPQSPTPGGDSAATLEEIVVTAQKRVQSLQDVPISVTVLSGDKIVHENFRSLQDLSRNQPALSIFPSGRAVRISLRGVASGTNPALDQSVATFIDDIYHGKSRASGSILLDVDRIEVLKGPQTTFFGNNAIGGAINVQTARPSNELEGSVRALYGTQSEYALEGVVNMPVSDTLAVRVAGLANGLNGYLKDRTAGGRAPRERNYAGRASALWKPTDDFSLYLKAEATDNRNRGGGLLQMVRCPPAAPFTAPGLFCIQALADGADTQFNNTRDQNKGQILNLFTRDFQATATKRFGAFTLTSVTGYSHFKFENTQDTDTTPEDLLNISQPERYRQFSQELRLASDDTGPVSFLAGLYYQSSRYHDTFDTVYDFLTPRINAAPPFAALRPFLPFGVSINYQLNEKTYSGFGSLTWHATDRLSITGGIRATQVTKRFNQVRYLGQATSEYGDIVPFNAAVAPLAQAFASGAALGTGGSIQLSRSDNKATPTANVQYKITPTISVYGSYTEGFKSGGFNGAVSTGIASQYPFDPEGVRAYEVGFRSELFNRRLLVNLTAFRSNYRNLQVTFNSVVSGRVLSLIQNAASEVSQGIEAETRLAVTRSFSLGTSMSFLDAHFQSYTNAPPTGPQRFGGATTQDLSGKRRIFAPKFAGIFSATYKHPITDSLNIDLEADLLHQSSYFLADANDPFLVQNPYNKVDLRAGIATEDSRWELAILAKNVNNAKIRTGGLDVNNGGTYVLSKERPRSAALQLRFKW